MRVSLVLVSLNGLMNHLKLLFPTRQTLCTLIRTRKKDCKILIKKRKILFKCLTDFCSVLNGICSTLKSDNERFFPRSAIEHKWWTEVKFMCQVENISENKGETERRALIYILLCFGFFIYFPFSLLIHHNGVFFARRW